MTHKPGTHRRQIIKTGINISAYIFFSFFAIVEGAWVDYHDGKYYLYYSGDNCCGDNANYAVMVARADNVFGPFTRFGETKADSSSVILSEDDTCLKRLQ